MMKIHTFVSRAALSAVFCFSALQVASAGTIIKLSLGVTAPDLEYIGGVFSTANDGVVGPASPGDQNTDIDFLDFLSDIPDVLTDIASFSLNGATATGPAIVVSGALTQPLVGGNFQLYDPSGGLLLDVNLTSSVFNSGVLGDTGSAFSVTNAVIVGGSLQPRIVDSSISFSIGMTSIVPNSGPLFTPVTEVFPVTFGILNDFTADGSQLIAGDVEVPEPTAILILAVAGMIGLPLRRRAS
jgi:hypothetical protein